MSFKKDERAFTQIVQLVLAVVLCFAILFIGIYVNSEIDDALISDFPDNIATGSISTTSYYKNNTKPNTWYYYNVTLPAGCTIGNLNPKSTNISFINNQTDNAASRSKIQFKFDINGHHVNQTVLNPGSGANITIQKLIANTNVSTTETTLNFGWAVNSSIGRIKMNYLTSSDYYQDGEQRTDIQNTTYYRIQDISTNQDSTLDIVQVVVIITILAAAIGAIFLFTRWRQ